ncbi:hypothetical protein BH11MYX1_BH11MYX1_16890 [soil metagenome]
MLATGCGSSTGPVEDPRPPTAAPRAPLSTEDACWARFVNYCPEEGPLTCPTKDGVKTIDTCSSMGGHCVGTDPENGSCVKGPAAACDHDIPETGGTCTGSTSCTWISRMGVAKCDCTSGHWDCGHAGI